MEFPFSVLESNKKYFIPYLSLGGLDKFVGQVYSFSNTDIGKNTFVDRFVMTATESKITIFYNVTRNPQSDLPIRWYREIELYCNKSLNGVEKLNIKWRDGIRQMQLDSYEFDANGKVAHFTHIQFGNVLTANMCEAYLESNFELGSYVYAFKNNITNNSLRSDLLFEKTFGGETIDEFTQRVTKELAGNAALYVPPSTAS